MKYTATLGCFILATVQPLLATVQSQHPYLVMVDQQIAKLESESPQVRAGAAEALGFLRAYQAEKYLLDGLYDPSSLVRRQAVMALASCGGREAVAHLLTALDDEDWVTRQAAHVSLTNLTGMEMPYDALATIAQREGQAKSWRDWYKTVPPDTFPDALLAPEVDNENPDMAWRHERGLRALGALGGPTATTAILDTLGHKPCKASKIGLWLAPAFAPWDDCEILVGSPI
ncbi:MAG: HEAT repeat domain-containing protein [Pirellulaceae bacterium]